jgi:hypothetical protein
MSKQLICSSCGHVGSSKTAIKGNGLIELILWLCFLVPGIIYSVWRSSSRYKTCSVCGSTNLVPLDTPIGRKMLADQGKTVEQAQAEYKKEKMPIFMKIAIGFLIFTVFVGIVSLITGN